MTGKSGQRRAAVLLSEMLTTLGAGVAMLGEDGTVTAWNLPAAEMSGYSLQEIKALGFAQLFKPAQRMTQIIADVRQTRSGASDALELQCPDGRCLPVAVWCAWLEQGDAAGACLIIGIREQQPSPTPWEHTDASARLRVFGQLAGTVSHELYNPLNAVSLHVDILADELKALHIDPHEQVQLSLDVIRRGIVRLSDFVQEYLTLARLPALSRQPHDLGALLEAWCLEMRERLAARQLKLHVDGVAHLGDVALHKPTFERALHNLLYYAIGALPPGGQVIVSGARTESRGRLEIRLAEHHLANDQMTALFHPTPPTPPQDTLLGLYLAHAVIQAHHGELSALNDPKQGLTFIISLPSVASPGHPER